MKYFPEYRKISERTPLYGSHWFDENVTKRGLDCSPEVAQFLFQCFEEWVEPFFAARIRADDRLCEDLALSEAFDPDWDLDLGSNFYHVFNRNILRMSWHSSLETVQDLLCCLGKAEREAAIGRPFYGLAPLEYLSDVVYKIREYLGWNTKKEKNGA